MGLQNSVPCWVVGRMTDKLPFAREAVRLGGLISRAKIERCGERSLPVLSMTMHDGITRQSDRFKKVVASRNTSSYKVVQPGQLVVGFPIDEGVIYVQDFDEPGIMSPAYNVWNIDSAKVLPGYLNAALHSPQSMSYYRAKLRGTTARRRTITDANLLALRIPLPDINEQHQIVESLNSIQNDIDSCDSQLDIISCLIKSRFVEMFDGAPWQVVRASDVMTSFRNGVSPSKDADIHERVLTLSAITQGHFDETAWKDGTFKELPASDKRVSDSDFYICRGNGNKQLVGVGEFADDNHPELVFPDTMIAGTINKNLVRKPFLTQVWKHPSVRRQIEAKARTTNGTLKINQKIVSEIRFPLPPLDAQDEFVSFIERVDKLRVVVEKEKQTLQTLYDSLAQEYFAI